MSANPWCREDPFRGLAPIVDVQTGRSYRADTTAAARLRREGYEARFGYHAEKKVEAAERSRGSRARWASVGGSSKAPT